MYLRVFVTITHSFGTNVPQSVCHKNALIRVFVTIMHSYGTNVP